MAKYTYKCDKHNHIFELEFSMTEERPAVIFCPECKYTAKRYFGSMPPVRYNGTGFASTDIPRKSGMEGYVS